MNILLYVATVPYNCLRTIELGEILRFILWFSLLSVDWLIMD